MLVSVLSDLFHVYLRAVNVARGPLMVITVSDGVFTDLVHVAFFFFSMMNLFLLSCSRELIS